MLLSPSTTSPNELEWAYCFDIHLNAFFAVFTILHLAQERDINILNRFIQIVCTHACELHLKIEKRHIAAAKRKNTVAA